MIELGAFPSAFDGGGAVYQTAPEWLGTIPARRHYSPLCWRALRIAPGVHLNLGLHGAGLSVAFNSRATIRDARWHRPAGLHHFSERAPPASVERARRATGFLKTTVRSAAKTNGVSHVLGFSVLNHARLESDEHPCSYRCTRNSCLA